MRRIIFCFTLAAVFGISVFAHAAMTGGNFEIYSDTVSFVSGDALVGGNFSLLNSAGEFFATTTSGGTVVLNGGFQAVDKTDISLSLSTSSLNLGTLSLNSVASAALIASVSTTNATGYVLSLTEDGNLRKGNSGDNDDIDDSANGNVAAGTEGYGIRTSGGGNLLLTDTAIAGTLAVARQLTSAANDETTMTFRAAIDTGSRSGNYSHIVTLSAVANP